MKLLLKIFAFILGSYLLLHSSAIAKSNGYKMQLNFKQKVTGEYIYLAKYHAKTFPTIYLLDSIKNDGSSNYEFVATDSILGGVYILLFNDKNKWFEVLIDNGYDFKIDIDTADIPFGLNFENSKENEAYLLINANYQQLRADVKSMERGEQGEVWEKYKKTYAENLIIANKFDKHNLFYKLIYAATPADASGMSSKDVFWRNFDLNDDRLIRTPLLHAKLKQYFDSYVNLYQIDSVIYEAERLLYYSQNSFEIQKYILLWLTELAVKSDNVLMDELFVHLVEHYYMQGKAPWIDQNILKSYIDRAHKLAPNVLGKKGANIKLKELYSLKNIDLYNFDATYTMLLFWSIDCSYCLEEVPKLKELYDAKLKKMGVRVFSVPTGNNQNDIIEMVDKLNLNDWVHAIDVDGTSDYLQMYDAYAKPKVYILDKQKMIKGKLLHHDNILPFMEYLLGK